MAQSQEVVQYIKQQLPNADIMRLCELAYFAQAWSLAWEGRPLFSDRIEACKHGPVPADGWHSLRYPQQHGGTPEALSDDARAIVDTVIEFYDHNSRWKLRDLKHAEDPWKEARGELPDTANSKAEITHASMTRYFTRLSLGSEAVPRRPSSHSPAPLESTLAAARHEATRWKPTLDWLAAH